MNKTNFEMLFEKIDELLQKGRTIVAIEGGSGSGKTTLAETLREKYDCAVFHTDDFFLQKHQRTAERYSEIGGNIDRERFAEEIVAPLTENKEVCYRKFDCKTFSLSSPVCVTPKKLIIVEGVYSMHSFFCKYYDLSVFLDIGKDTQKRRIEQRNTKQMAERYFSEWVPLENTYFEKTDTKNRCDFVIEIIE